MITPEVEVPAPQGSASTTPPTTVIELLDNQWQDPGRFWRFFLTLFLVGLFVLLFLIFTPVYAVVMGCAVGMKRLRRHGRHDSGNTDVMA